MGPLLHSRLERGLDRLFCDRIFLPGREAQVGPTVVFRCDVCKKTSVAPATCNEKIWTLGGGSLGSCVDEERSQLRELM